MSNPEDDHPRLTDQMRGHEKILSQLVHTFETGGLPNAYVFCGPKGIGKATTAYLFARHLLYSPAASSSLFGQDMGEGSQTTTLIKSGSHPNLQVVVSDISRKSEDISVEDVRAAQHFLQQTSLDDAWRLVIVDAADNLTRQASNALLKFLEEPPQKVLFILISHQPGRLLPTLRSRCQRITFAPLNQPDFHSVLLKRFPEKSLKNIEPLAQLYRGRVGAALEVLSSSENSDDLGDVLGLFENVDDSLRWFKFAASLSSASSMGRYGVVKETMLNLLALVCRALASRDYRVTSDFKEVFEKLRTRHSAHTLSQIWSQSKDVFDQAEHFNLDRHYTIENVGRLLRAGR